VAPPPDEPVPVATSTGIVDAQIVHGIHKGPPAPDAMEKETGS